MRLVIVGNGVAGVTTARFAADLHPEIEDQPLQITLYSQEPYSYYPRPRLIDLLAGLISVDDMNQYPPSWYAERGIETVLDRRVTSVQPDSRRVTLDDGSQVKYDKLVLAVGASPWIPPIPGADSPGVHCLRCMNDALVLRREAAEGRAAVMIGGGLLGLDTAMALRAHNIPVTVVELLPWLLPRQLDAEGAVILQRRIESRGVEVITGASVSQIEGQDRVERVHLIDGRVLDAGFVVVSAGVRPNLALAQTAGLACNRGIQVNERLETSDPNIYAVGDAAEFAGRVWGIIPAALAQARVAAAQIVGQTDRVYEDIVPSTTLQVTGIDLTSIGLVNPDGDGFMHLRHADEERGVYKKLVLQQGKAVGAILLGDNSSLRAVNALINSGVDVSKYQDVLLQDDFDLMSVARGEGN